MNAAELYVRPSGSLPALVALRAAERPDAVAMVVDGRPIDYAGLNALADRTAAALQRDGFTCGDVVAIAAATSIAYAAVLLGAVRAGLVVAPLATWLRPDALRRMLADSGARLLFTDAAAPALPDETRRIALDDADEFGEPFERWLAPAGATPAPVDPGPEAPFSLIYSSGTTGVPKGVIQTRGAVWFQATLARLAETDVLAAGTPLYASTALLSLFRALTAGATVLLTAKFDALGFMRMAITWGATQAFFVPVQYERILRLPEFDSLDLSRLRSKVCSGAPCSAAVKAEILARWPGALTEYYGMTEGAVGVMLAAHERPDKLHTVGRPGPDVDLRVIDDEGRELPPGQVGEIVGHAFSMMKGYFNRPEASAGMEWRDPSGRRFLRTGDLGSVDEEGFVTLVGRKKDMIISGGFNVYPADLEQALLGHEAVDEAAVVAAPSARWGETPAGFVTLRPGARTDPQSLLAFANARLGKVQRLSAVDILPELPKSPVGKVLKAELRALCGPQASAG